MSRSGPVNIFDTAAGISRLSKGVASSLTVWDDESNKVTLETPWKWFWRWFLAERFLCVCMLCFLSFERNLLFSKDALHWSKVTINTYTVLQIKFTPNKCEINVEIWILYSSRNHVYVCVCVYVYRKRKRVF